MADISRFEVMAVLQAARAHVLGLPLDEAKSWGMNRAIFYLAAKNAWADAKAIGLARPVIREWEEHKRRHDPPYFLGGEKAFRSRDLRHGLRFKFGNRVQYPEEFDRRVAARFDDWDHAWNEALGIVRSAARRDLDIQSRFYRNIYEPLRDHLAERWSTRAERRRAA